MHIGFTQPAQTTVTQLYLELKTQVEPYIKFYASKAIEIKFAFVKSADTLW